MIEALWFFGGAMTFSILSRLFRAGQLVRLAIEVGVALLVLASYIYDDLKSAQDTKYKKLKNNMEDEDLKLLKEVDQAALDVWRQGIIFKFKSLLPVPVRSVFSFKDWDGAMKFLHKNIEKI